MENNTPDNSAGDNQTINTDQTTVVFDAEAKEKHKKLVLRGQRWLGVGVLLMGFSFLLNFALMGSDLGVSIPMYVLTTAGALCIFKGLMDIFGF